MFGLNRVGECRWLDYLFYQKSNEEQGLLAYANVGQRQANIGLRVWNFCKKFNPTYKPVPFLTFEPCTSPGRRSLGVDSFTGWPPDRVRGILRVPRKATRQPQPVSSHFPHSAAYITRSVEWLAPSTSFRGMRSWTFWQDAKSLNRL